MPSHDLRFPVSRGHDRSATLDLPVGDAPRAYAILAHCFSCSPESEAAVALSQSLNQVGIAVLRFDFTGQQEQAENTNALPTSASDIIAAAEFLGREHETPRLLVGHSFGGAAVLQAAHHLPSVTAVATLGAPFGRSHIRHLLGDPHEETANEDRTRITLEGRSFHVRKELMDSLEPQNVRRVLRDLERALLIFHAPTDQLVGIENAARIFRAARHPKSFVSLDQTDHLLTQSGTAHYVGTVLGAWASRYLGEAPQGPLQALEVGGDHQVAVRTARQRFRTEIAAGPHSLLADEPEPAGGADTGPTPYDLLLAALGSCTSITLRMYADRKGWPLEEAVVRLKHAREHAHDAEVCEDRPPRLDVIEREVELVGPLDDAQRARLLEIAEKCPVHRTLEAGVRTESRLRS